jgi:glycerate kinase
MTDCVGLRYLVAPDKFKGTLSAVEAAAAMSRGIRQADPEATIVELPFADGGEGTIDAIVHAGGARQVSTVTGPLGGSVDAMWAILGDTAFIEMAQSSGLRHVEPSPATALDADTTGTGELILRALDAGVVRIVIGVGGSATTDGGFGALRALGVTFLDARGDAVDGLAEVESIDSLDHSGVDPRLHDAELQICADVISPLTGSGGAAHVFGAQKGADAMVIAQLERRLRHLEQLYAAQPEGRMAVQTGGAAGGLAAGIIAVLGAKTAQGVDLLAELLHLDSQIIGADVVVVGEGSLDDQSRFGKTPVGIARRARAHGVPAIAAVGTTTLSSGALIDDGIAVVVSAVNEAPSTAAALVHPAQYVQAAACTAVRKYLAGCAEHPRQCRDGSPTTAQPTSDQVRLGGVL